MDLYIVRGYINWLKGYMFWLLFCVLGVYVWIVIGWVSLFVEWFLWYIFFVFFLFLKFGI